MKISVFDQNNAFYDGVDKAWAHGWTSQKIVGATQAGGTYEVVAPHVEVVTPEVEEPVKPNRKKTKLA